MNHFPQPVTTIYDEEIAAALHRTGSVQPMEGFQARLHARLAAHDAPFARNIAPSQSRAFLLASFLHRPAGRLAFGSVAATLACWAMLMGTLHHGRKLPPLAGQATPVSVMPSNSLPGHFGAASGSRPANQAIRPTADPGSAPAGELAPRSRTIKRSHQGRAILLSPPGRKTDDSTAPVSPFPSPQP